ncbi:lipid kinase YegS [Luteimonas sp. MJ174]|uniref:lipid kinase YegS n=1 Tax=Luteimonas sp. MJ174 TaxID=3129237 RepID=UPI0031BA3939
MSAPRWLLVINGKAAGDDALREAVEALRKRGVDIGVRVTWEHGDGARCVDIAVADGVDAIVAAGGDGTLSEIVTALAGRNAGAGALPALGLVPMGTANDFASAAGIPDAPLAALELLLAEPARDIDLLRLESADGTHWAANLASAGFGTQVTVDTDEGLKKLLGGLAYLVTGLARLGRIDPIAARLSGPGFEWEGGFIALGIGNGRQAGGGQALCPDALVDDGLLDVTVVPDLEGEVAATLGTVLAEGRGAALERVAVRARLPWLEIEAVQPMTINLDGEPVEGRRFRAETVARRLRMHLPLDCALLSRGDADASSTEPR